MSLTGFGRLAALLARLGRSPATRPPPRILEERDLSARDRATYDLYRPRREPLGTVIAVHGVTTHGRTEPRLVHFARCLALSRVACVVPTLPGLTDCTPRTGDIDDLEAVGRDAETRTGQRPGLIGFSFGGSYALLAAPRLAPRFVLTFGAYASLARVFEAAASAAEPTSDKAWDELIYLHLASAYQHRDTLSLPPEVTSAARSLLERYCHEATLDEKRAFFEAHLRPRDVVRHGLQHSDPGLLAALSPAGNLDGLTCPTSLLHDRDDAIVPADQAESLHAELERVAPDAVHQVLVTRMLSHVSPGDVLRVGELRRFARALAPILEG